VVATIERLEAKTETNREEMKAGQENLNGNYEKIKAQMSTQKK
jgi:hypothetical protein